MKIGLDVTILRHGANGGTALYAYNLARALLRHAATDRLALYMGARESAKCRDILRELRQLGADVIRGPIPDRWSPDAAWWLPLPRGLPSAMRDLDIYHAGEFFFPRPGAVPAIATVHDLTELLFPTMHTRLNRSMHWRRLRWIERHAVRVIAVSNSTREDLFIHASVEPRRVRTVHEARSHSEIPMPTDEERREALQQLGIFGRRYVLCVSTIEPRKNHVRLVRAFERLPDHHDDVFLVLVGGNGWHANEILETIDSSVERCRILMLGHLPPTALMSLYTAATVFAYPSLYEGFGLPVLEAMAAGVPVLTSDRSSMPEVAGTAAVFVNPESVEEISNGLTRLLDDPDLRLRLQREGRCRESEFSWDRTAEETIGVYRAALEEGRR